MKLLTKKKQLYILKKALYNDLDAVNTGGPLLLAEKPALKDWEGKTQAGCTLVVPFQDPANVGSVVRTAVSFGVEQILLLKEAASPFHPKSIRSSAGSVFQAPLVYGPSFAELAEYIQKNNIPALALDTTGKNIKEIEFPERFLLIPGLEGQGLPEKIPVQAVAIPIDDKMESLNATVATACALYEWQSRRVLTRLQTQ